MARSLARLGNNGFACMTSARETQQGFLGVGRNERAVFGQHVAAAEAATGASWGLPSNSVTPSPERSSPVHPDGTG